MAEQDRWNELLYPGTATLRNKFGVTDYSRWQEIEGKAAWARALALPELGFSGTLSEQLRQTHQHLFQDCYRWAGAFRTFDMTVPSPSHPLGKATFAHWETVEDRIDELDEVLDALDSAGYDDVVEALAYMHCELNEIHPFREGNGRTTRALIETIARRHDVELCWDGYVEELHATSAESMAGVMLTSAPFQHLYQRICQPATFDEESELSIDAVLSGGHETNEAHGADALSFAAEVFPHGIHAALATEIPLTGCGDTSSELSFEVACSEDAEA